MASHPDSLAAGAAVYNRARALVMKFGWNAVAYQILNPGFALWLSRADDAVAGFARCSRRWVVAGAPICERDRLPEIVQQFEADARTDGCRVCYFGAAVRLYEGCRNPPQHSVVCLGAQPVWNPAGWQKMLRRRSSVRAQIHRARNKSVVADHCPNPDDALIARMQAVLNAWIAHRHMPPMHFLVEPETLHRLEDRRVFLATQGGCLVGFLIASPIPARGGWLVEQIIRRPDAPNGTNELLVHTAMVTFAAEHCPYVTLGLVPLSSRVPADGPANPLWLKILFAWVRAHGRRFYNFQGLENFKSKFQPDQWEPIYAIATEPRFSFRTLWSIAAAFSHNNSPLVHCFRALGMAIREEFGRMIGR